VDGVVFSFFVVRERGSWENNLELTVPVCALGAEEFEDVDAAAAVGGLEDY
jgi:hypothetical protein